MIRSLSDACRGSRLAAWAVLVALAGSDCQRGGDGSEADRARARVEPSRPAAGSAADAPDSAAASGTATDSTAGRTAPFRFTLAQLRDAWLSSDAVAVGTYRGVDEGLGARYHVLEAEDVWYGTPAPGRVVFKAPRGVRGRPGDEMILMLWDRLGGASDSYLEESKTRYGVQTWANIGADSIAAYLLPFPNYSFPLVEGKLPMRGSGVFGGDEMGRGELKKKLLDFGWELLPQNLYKTSDVVVRAKVRSATIFARNNPDAPDIVVEYRVQAELRPIETLKGSAPSPLQLQFASFPRSPRFREDEEVLLFLSLTEGGLYLPHGKRDVYHVVGGEVLETGRPLSEFVKSLRGA